MNVNNLAQKVAGKVRSAQRVKFRRLMGSTYDRNQKRWKDSKEVREFLKIADTPPSISSPAKEGPVQKYAIGCNVRYTHDYGNLVYMGQIRMARFAYYKDTEQETVEYLILATNACTYWIKQSNILGLAD